MDFRGMKRRDLQSLCKKHGIPANLKNTEMASRLASVFEKETVSETRLSPDGIKATQAVCRKAKKVTFSPESENEVFEFTRSVKPQRKNVKTRSQGTTQDLQQGGTMLRRSTRLAAKAGTLVPAKRLCRSKRSADNMMGQAMSDSPKRCSVVDSARGGAFVDSVKKLDVSDEMQVRVRFSRNNSKSGSLVKSSKRVTRSMSGIDIETASTQGNLMPEKPQFEQEEAGGANVETRGSSKKPMIMNQECVEDTPQVMIEISPSSSDTKASESVMLTENVLDSTPKVSVEAKFAEAEGTTVLENSAKCRNEINSSKDGEKCALENERQSANRHGNFSEYNAENSSVEEQADICKVGHCVNRGMPDEVKDDSECLEEDELKALSQPILIIKAASNALDESAVFSTPERSLMLVEQKSENGKIRAADTGTHHNDEAVESHAVVSTTPEQVSLLCDSELDEVGKEEERTATDLPDEYDVPNTTERYLMLGGSRKNEARNEGESMVVELHDESNIATSPLRQSSVGDFKGDGIERSEENRNVELHCEAGTCTTADRHALLGNSVSDGAETSGGNKAMEFKDFVVFTGLEERHEFFGYSGQDKFREAEKAATEFRDESAAPNIPERHSYPEESGLDEEAKSEENKAVGLQVDCDIFTGAEKHFLVETDEGMKGDNITAKSHDMSDVLTASESHSLMGDFEPAESENKYRESKDVELLAESNISTNLERYLLSGESGLDGTRKRKYNTAATCKESLFFTSPEINQLIGNSEPHTAGKQERKEVEFKDESAFFTRLDSRLLLGESGQDRVGNSKSGSSQYQSHHASSLKVAALDFRKNTFADSSGSIASKVSYSHELNSREETAGAEFIPKGYQAMNVVGLDAIQGTSNQSRRDSPQADSVNLFDFDTEGAEAIMDAERKFCILALPAKGNSEITGKIPTQLEVAETCSLVCEESSPSANIQNQIYDASEELAIADNNEEDEIIEAKVMKNSQRDYKGNLLLDSSRGSSVFGKTCVLSGTEDEHLGCNSEENVRNTCEKSGRKILENEATGPIATPFEEATSLTPSEFIVQDNINEEGLDATHGTSKQIRGHSPHVNSVNLCDFDTEGTETTIEAERNVPLSSYVLAVPAEGDFKTISEISSHLQVAGTSSMVSEESAPSTDTQNQINDALEELAITDHNQAGEIIEATATKNLDSSGSSSVYEKTYVLGGTEHEHLGYNSEVDFKNTYEESGHKFLKHEATDPIATAFEKDIPLVPDEFTVHNNRNEEADVEMIERETTPSPEETLNESSENRKEYLNIGESGTLCEKQATRVPMLIYRTQVKPKRQDMKENAPNSKIVDNLNVTAPRKSKRQPLQDLRKD